MFLIAFFFALILLVSLASAQSSVCPNGIQEQGEQCDDGNIIDGDGCTSTCLTEPLIVCQNVWEQKFGGTSNEIGYSVKETFDCSQKFGCGTTPVSTGYVLTGTHNTAQAQNIWVIRTNEKGETCAPTGSEEICSASATQWISDFGESSNDEGRSIIQYFDPVTGSADGFVAGGTIVKDADGSEYMSLTKMDALGNTSWLQEFGGPAFSDKGFSVAQSNSSIMLLGETYSFAQNIFGAPDIWLLKRNSDGTGCPPDSVGFCSDASTFSRTFGRGAMDEGKSIDTTNDGGFVLFGSMQDPLIFGLNFGVIKTDSLGVTCSDSINLNECHNGTAQFVNIFPASGFIFEEGWSVHQTNDGGYILAGNTPRFSSNGDIWVIKLNDMGENCGFDPAIGECSNGSVQFARVFGGGSVDEVFSVQQTSDGGYIVVGTTRSFSSNNDLWVIKTDSSGNTCPFSSGVGGGNCSNGTLQFAHTFDNANDDGGYSIEQTSDGGYIITGYTEIDSTDKQLWLLKLDALGNGPASYGVCGFCGNSFFEPDLGEECDMGSTGTDFCTSNCTITFCGDGTPQAVNGLGQTEVCDDGNTANGDDCDSFCQLETGIIPGCGNGVWEVGEECDNGLNNSDTTPDACRTTCISPACGDSVIDTGEQCDDGGTVNGDGCSATCQLEVPPGCGNGVREVGEECDDGNTVNTDQCSNSCMLTFCGDGTPQAVNGEGKTEECDDGNPFDFDACSNNCIDNSASPNGFCGDGTKQSPNSAGYIEECDEFVKTNNCSAECLLTYCGDGTVQPTNSQGVLEVCDDGNIIDGDGCSSICQVEFLSACQNIWEQKFGDGDSEFGYSVKETFSCSKEINSNCSPTSTGYVLAGKHTISTGGENIWLIKTDESGASCVPTGGNEDCGVNDAAKFMRTFGGTGADEGRSVIQYFNSFGNADGYAVAGTFYDAFLNKNVINVIKTNQFGNITGGNYWDKKFGGNKGFSVVQKGSALFATGYTTDGTSVPGLRGLRYINLHENGTIDWSKIFELGSWSEGSAVVNGNAVTGFGVIDSKRVPWAIKTMDDGSACNYSFGSCFDPFCHPIFQPNCQFFVSIFSDFSDSDSEASAIDSTTDGGFIIAGFTDDTALGVLDALLIKVDVRGETCDYSGGECNGVADPDGQFVKKFGGPYLDTAFAVAQTSDGGYVFAGRTFSFGDAVEGDIWIVKTDSFGDTCKYGSSGKCFNGTTQFANVIGASNDFDIAFSVEQTSDGGYILTGASGPTDSDVWLIKLDAFGNAPPPYGACGGCGNGFFEPDLGEECDDGNNVNNDFCTDTCKVTFCGDGVVQFLNGQGIKEQCDPGKFCSDFTPCTSSNECNTGDGLCLVRNTGTCFSQCRDRFASVEIVDVILKPNVLNSGKDVDDFKVVLNSTEDAPASIAVMVKNKITGQVLWETPPLNFTATKGENNVDLIGNPDFSALPLGIGSYDVEVVANVFVGTVLEDRKTVFLTISSVDTDSQRIVIPDFNLLLLPLLLFAVISLLLKK